MNYSNYHVQGTVGQFMYKVYGWMSAALAITATVAYYVGTTSLFTQIFQYQYLYWLFIFAELGLVIFLSTAIMKINYSTAALAFVGYSVLNGLTLSFIFQVYMEASIYSTFLITAGMFAGMALYGYVTKADLTSMGNIAIMILFGLIIGHFVNIFVRSSHAEYLFSVIGVVVFCLLTAYDVQKIKRLFMSLQGSGQDLAKIALLGALTLYLDFINLFISLLHIMGRRRD